MIRLQEWIYKFEVGEGTRVIRLLLAVLALLALAAIYDLREFKNFSTAEAMDSAQLARNIAEAARRLKTDRPNLYRRMKRLGIPVGNET